MAWRLIEVPDGESEGDLTSGELVGVSILLAQGMGEPANELNVYYRAWLKLQPQVRAAMDDD
ncbi:hypothetical protein vBPaeMUSP18_09 [Pseudomonas phage vB_PaeM_USP_18]|nr:hypothetical protein vBPaeMUSP18_09 [Pseudomonas phage vB_PaeM_USP_18]QLI49530.1 hypothetical protein vBPaeMUSP25_09 [Pseudomonas phage vB_PaeM_USP_25]